VIRTYRARFLTLSVLRCSATLLVVAAEFSSAAAQDAPTVHAVVPAYERFRAENLSSIDAGKLLISELNCQSCHGSILQETLAQRQAPILTDTAKRITPEHLLAFIADPQAIKPGTAMPQVLQGADSKQAAEALTHFLKDGGATIPSAVSSAASNRGNKLFHTVGCAACHGNLEQTAAERPAYVMPIGQPDTKYTVASLTGFLKNPHAVRPSGRMPALNLNDEEANDIANYLLQHIEVEAGLVFEFYEGSWTTLPNFDELKPKATGMATDFDVAASGKKENFALRFNGFLHIPRDGKYEIFLGSDDGSRLLLDGKEIVNADGVHPHSVKQENVDLTAGPHAVVVEYFEAGGEEVLTVEIAGPDLQRQPMAGLVSETEEPPEQKNAFQPDVELVKQGRELFVKLGCASCHQHDAVKDLQQPATGVPKFKDLNLKAGCLAQSSAAAAPKFALTTQQREDITAAVTAALQDSIEELSPKARIASTMLTLNCYACHQRDKFGGVPREQDALFTGSIPEMGDEGRVPPHLDGVGDKLQASWLREVMNNGAKDRPYMATRMPKFGEKNVGQLIALFAEVDSRTEIPDVTFEDPDHRVIAEARLMVGDQSLSCIKCHYFDKHKATGIQSLDMTTMTKRLRRDWFHRYLINPQEYRPGTRMPGAWPSGRTVVRNILHGDTPQQIEAIWRYLSDGNKAKVPSGLTVEAIELKPVDKPIIYRNFIEGLSSRGIAVGYPEKAHIAWDAEQMNLRLIWHGAFIDASKHWTGRGQGAQTPLGDHLIELTPGQPLARLDNVEASWPTEASRDAGFEFNGYQLDKAGRPAFRYSWNGVSATDFIEPIPGQPDSSLRRILSFSAEQPVSSLYFRVGSASSMEEKDGGWLLDKAVQLKFLSGEPVVRTVNGKQELLVPLMFDGTGKSSVVYEIIW
jgi:mono/diheme cytochrome c family protein